MTFTRLPRALVLSALAVLLLAIAAGCGSAAPTSTTSQASGGATPASQPKAAASPTPAVSAAATPAPSAAASATGTATTTGASTGAIAAQPSGNLSGEIKLGAVETLTGDNSSYGISIKNALDLAVQEINQNKYLGNATISLTTLDDKADKQEGISVTQRLINQDKVVGIIGPTLSSTAFAADPIAQQAGIPVLATSNTANGITDMGNFIFRDSLPEAGVIPGTIDAVAKKLSPKKAAIMYEVTNEFTKSAYDVFVASLQKNNIQVTDTEAYNHGDTDFRTQLTKIKATNPDLLVVSALIGEAVPIIQQAREVGITQPIVGGNGFNNPNIYKQGGQAAEGVIVGSAWFVGSTNPKSQAFVEAYRKKYNSDPDQFAAQAYDGMYLMASAIKNAGSANPKAIRDALAAIRNYNGVLGNFSFDDHRDPVHQPVVLQVKGGKFELFQ